MELASIQAHALSSPIDPVQERSFHGGVRRLLKRDVVVVIVETLDGARGIAPAGASSSAMREFFEGDSQQAFAETIESRLAPALTDRRFESPGELREAVAKIGLPDRVTSEALGALDVAFHDLLGKEQGRSVAAILAENGSIDRELALYASAGMYMPPSGYIEQAARLEEHGFFGYKYRPGIGPEADRETVEGLAERLGSMHLMLDAHTWWKIPGEAYDTETVTDLVGHAGDHDAYWVEEPVEPSDYDGYRRLARLNVPLAGGESEPHPAGLRSLAETGAVSFLQGDVRHHAGFTGCWELATACPEWGIQFVPHHFGTWLGLIANAQLVAAAPETTLLEYPVFTGDPLLGSDTDLGMYPFPLAFDLIEETPRVTDGILTVPDAPGLGVTLNDDALEDYPFQEGPWTTFEATGE